MCVVSVAMGLLVWHAVSVRNVKSVFVTEKYAVQGAIYAYWDGKWFQNFASKCEDPAFRVVGVGYLMDE